jgi:DNA polymerase elongation subunit (family B)/uracil DNA glycosylase
MSSSKSSFNFFPFQWQYENTYIDDDEKCYQTVIHIYGWNEKNESVHIRVEDFPIPIWVELPSDIEWTENRIDMLQKKLSSFNKEETYNPKSIILQYKQPLYFAHLEKDDENPGKYKNKKFPYLLVTFRNTKAIEFFTYKLKQQIYVTGLGNLTLKCHCYEKSTTPIIKLLAFKQLPSANWILAKGEYVSADYRETTKCHEYICSFKNLQAHPNSDNMPVVYPKVLSFDNEAYSSNPGSMPKSTLPSDKVFMIGCTICEIIQKKKVYNKYILTLGECDPVEGVTIIKFKTELKLYLGFSEFIRKHDPDVIIGYNIFGWDIKYMVERSEKILMCLQDFKKMGAIPNKECPVMNESWESSAYGKQDMTYLELDGRLFIDMFPYIQRNFKLSNYRLETVCDEFLKTNKDPLKAKDMFSMYKGGNPSDMAIIASYCAQDSYVTILLYDKLLTWFDLTETATTNGVPIFYIYTKGQQIKIYSQLLKYCSKNNIVVQSNAYKVDENDDYVGASVTQPKAGLYKNILPFDFASLYPSIIMAHNIDFSTLAMDPNIPDELCHVVDGEDHLNCKCDKDPKKDSKRAPPKGKNGKIKRICGKFKDRFLKADVVGKGVIPTLLENLIKARKDTRKKIAINEEEIERLRALGENEKADELESMNLVYDKRQLSYKVSANSMYGAMGVKEGKLPLLPGARSTTYIGRVSIKKASQFLEDECNGQVIYNDTDSAYTYFPEMQNKTPEEIWQFAEDVVRRVAKLFPSPMKLEFEDKIYHKFLILTKKRYVAQPISREGVIETKLFKRGVVLQRRDNCPLLRDIYQQVVWYVLDNIDHLTEVSRESTSKELLSDPIISELLNMVSDQITDSLFNFKNSYKNFVITKALKRETYKNKTLPSHVFVAKKMRERGIDVPQNSRIEYVLLNNGNGYRKDELQNAKVEDVNFYIENKDLLRLDYLYYLEKQFAKPLKEILNVTVFQTDFMKHHLKHRIQKSHIITQLKGLFSPKLNFIDNVEISWKNMSLYEYTYAYDGAPFAYKDFFNKEEVVDMIDYISSKLEKENQVIYPSIQQVYRALSVFQPKTVLLGREPSSSCGLAFSVENGINMESKNILQEVRNCGYDIDDKNGDLSLWEKNGVMLLHTSLTSNNVKSHKTLWMPFIKLFLEYLKCPVGLLMNEDIDNYSSYFDNVINFPNPSNTNEFIGSKCFNKVNNILSMNNKRINWNTIEYKFDLPSGN